MTLRVYGIPMSRAIRVFWMAEELGVPYEQVATDFKDEGEGPTGKNNAAFRAASPVGRVPAIDDDGVKVFESMAINLYLARKHGKGLWPGDLAGEAHAYQWSFFAVTEIDGTIIEWARNAFVLPEAERDPKKAADAIEKLKRPLAALNGALSKSPYLAGDRFTVADLNLAAAMFRARRMDLAGYPHIKRWLDACFARPAAGRAWALRGE